MESRWRWSEKCARSMLVLERCTASALPRMQKPQPAERATHAGALGLPSCYHERLLLVLEELERVAEWRLWGELWGAKDESGPGYACGSWERTRRTGGDWGEPGIFCRVACSAVLSWRGAGWRGQFGGSVMRPRRRGCVPWPRWPASCARCRSAPCRSRPRSSLGTRRASA